MMTLYWNVLHFYSSFQTNDRLVRCYQWCCHIFWAWLYGKKIAFLYSQVNLVNYRVFQIWQIPSFLGYLLRCVHKPLVFLLAPFFSLSLPSFLNFLIYLLKLKKYCSLWYMFQVYNIVIHNFKRLYSIYSYYKILTIFPVLYNISL